MIGNDINRSINQGIHTAAATAVVAPTVNTTPYSPVFSLGDINRFVNQAASSIEFSPLGDSGPTGPGQFQGKIAWHGTAHAKGLQLIFGVHAGNHVVTVSFEKGHLDHGVRLKKGFGKHSGIVAELGIEVGSLDSVDANLERIFLHVAILAAMVASSACGQAKHVSDVPYSKRVGIEDLGNSAIDGLFFFNVGGRNVLDGLEVDHGQEWCCVLVWQMRVLREEGLCDYDEMMMMMVVMVNMFSPLERPFGSVLQ